MSYLLTQIGLYMIVTFFLGLLLGWLIWRYGKDEHPGLAKLQAECNALRKEGDDLRTNLDACRARSAKERDAAEALRAQNAALQAQLDSRANVSRPVTRPLADAAPVAAAAVAAPVPVKDAAKPKGLSAPRNGKADDLQRINGVGPKMENLLYDLGYYHFDQIAAWTPAEVAWVDNNLEGFKGRVTRDNWQAQAKQLA